MTVNTVLRAILAICSITSTVLIGACTEKPNTTDGTSSAGRSLPPQIRIVGDDRAVGSVVYVDGNEVATIPSSFLGMPQVYVAVRTGQRVIEIRRHGRRVMTRTINVEPDSGVIGLPASDDDETPAK